MRFPRAVDFCPAMRTAGTLMLGRDELEFFLELRIAHDLVAQRPAPGRDDLDHCLHSLGQQYSYRAKLRPRTRSALRPARIARSSARCHANESWSLTCPKQPQEISRPRAFAEMVAPMKTSISASTSTSAPE